MSRESVGPAGGLAASAEMATRKGEAMMAVLSSTPRAMTQMAVTALECKLG
jgi:hypothetical protein